MHVINFETTDTQQDAAEGAKEAFALLQLVRMPLYRHRIVSQSQERHISDTFLSEQLDSKGDSWSDEVDSCIAEYLADLHNRKLPERSLLHEVMYY